MLEWISELDPETIAGWIAVASALMAIVAKYRADERQNRWARIRGIIPDAHRLAERVAAHTRAKKDDEFVRQARKLLEAFGVDLTPEEEVAVRALGSAEHQSYKLERAKARAAELAAAEVIEGRVLEGGTRATAEEGAPADPPPAG